MGLDITAYARIRKVGVADIDEWEEKWWGKGLKTLHVWPGYVEAPEFPGRLEGSIIEPNGVYAYDQSYSFEAGSYSGYMDWRTHLSALAHGVSAHTVWHNREHFRGKAFYELIDFSYCEGFIGPVVSAKLLKDFDDFAGKVAAEDERFSFLYASWCQAFALAADDGIVEFH